MFHTLFGRHKASPPPQTDARRRVRLGLTHLESRDVPAVIYDNTFALSGSGGEATVRVVVDNPAPAATPTYIWTYTVTNVNIGSNDPQDYIDSDSQTSFWISPTEAVSDFGDFLSVAVESGWTGGSLFPSADGNTTVYWGLYAGSNPSRPNLGHNESATFSFTTDPRGFTATEATFGDDTFGEATGTVVVPATRVTADDLLPNLQNFSFEFPDGAAGTGRFVIPATFVPSPGSPMQTVAVTDFQLSFAGYEFDGSNLDAPAEAVYQNGLFVGLNFSLSTLPAGTGYALLTGTGPNVTGATLPNFGVVQAPVLFTADTETITLDFTKVQTGKAYTIQIQLDDTRGVQVLNERIAIGANASVDDVREAVLSRLKDKKFFVKSAGDNLLQIGGALGGKPLSVATIEFGSVNNQNQFVRDKTLKGPAYKTGSKEIIVSYNGTTISPTN